MGGFMRWMSGWVRIQLEGPYPERWFNLFAAHALPFWDAAQSSGTCARFTLSRSDLPAARRLAEQIGAQLTVVEQGGLPVLLLGFRHRWGMIVGAALLAMLVGVLGQFIMVVEVEGNQTIPDAAVVALLQRCGFGVGSYGPGADVRALSNRALIECPELAFLTVDIRGICAHVVVREADPVPEIQDNTTPADIVAARDGWLVRVDQLEGEPQFVPGDAVVKGETIVSHLLVNYRKDGSGEVVSTRSVRARGEVWAMTEHDLTAALPLSACAPGAEQAVGWGIRFLGHRLNFYGNSSHRDRECGKMGILTAARLPGDTALPFGTWQLRWYARADQPVTMDPEQGAALVKQILRSRLEDGLEQGRILNARWQTEQREGTVMVTLRAVCLEQIGVSVDVQP